MSDHAQSRSLPQIRPGFSQRVGRKEMFFEGLSPSTSLKLVHYADIDQFRQGEKFTKNESIPLNLKNFAATRASVQLPLCAISLQRTFPRIIDGYQVARGTYIIVPMDDVKTTTVNGATAERSSLMIIRSSAPCKIVEREARMVAALSFPSDMFDRGWPDFEVGYRLLTATTPEVEYLKATIRSIIEVASGRPERLLMPEVLWSMQAALLAVLDRALIRKNSERTSPRRALVRYSEVIDHIDEALALAPSATIYSEDLASRMGISVRTLHAAVESVRGMSIHRYLKLRRLWKVRSRLANGGPTTLVKACALANGFWHLGEFSGAYRAKFGESPSETLARAKRSPDDIG